ncbi:TonB-dependent receptor [Robertkochia marina]|uniref:TonB-dependent receptor n=1 Tax=Robertkochia marina TaxID=1227945 RepID=A0A4S3M350_9FLAO|nr:TonB-dependent receptor [Robertkochia marina]THD69516.1 TonB-dependent receptor [Robertkochia marina]TRZ47225.1 TonB-dependent receptor [Robertkochia marina]
MFQFGLWLTCLCFPALIISQNTSSVTGSVADAKSYEFLKGVEVCFDECMVRVNTDKTGVFILDDLSAGKHLIIISHPRFQQVNLPVVLKPDEILDLGKIFLERTLKAQSYESSVEEESIAELTDVPMIADFSVLNAQQDLYERRSAFNFGKAFYRIRGYDSKYREVLINGIPVYDEDSGRAPFSLWGGLNDMFRDREFAPGLNSVSQSFGSIGGTTQFILKPANNRSGFRVTSSASNRSYLGRGMFTYNSGLRSQKWAFSFSASRRWAEQGYIEGTLYDAYSLFGAVQLNLGKGQELVFNIFYAPQRRGMRSALTEEVVSLAGARYNPYWGLQDGKIRNARTRSNRQPVFLLNYFRNTSRGSWQIGLLHTSGIKASSRLGYYNAPNPFPDYYRYLPSWQLNGNMVNFENAREVGAGFSSNPQLNWAELYKINAAEVKGGMASYIEYEDIVSSSLSSLSVTLTSRSGKRGRLHAGVNGRFSNSQYFARIIDLLGADYHLDRDPFSETRNDLNTEGMSYKGDRIGYNYQQRTMKAQAYIRYHRNFNRGQAYLSYRAEYLNTVRDGLFRNERYPENSFGEGQTLTMTGHSSKAGLNYRISGRHILDLELAWLNQLPLPGSLYINPRENHLTIKDPVPEQITGADLRYRMDLPDLKLRATAYFTLFSDLTDVNYFYFEGGVGNAFVQELNTGINKRHYGGELSLEYSVSSDVKFDLVWAHGVYEYTTDPNLSLTFNTVNTESSINAEGALDLGPAFIAGTKIAQGPQTAGALGVEYRSPEYWWSGLTISYLDNNYIGLSNVRRTSSFYLDPETGEEFTEIDPEISSLLLKQERLQPIYYLDLAGGKSWLVNTVYISVFASVNNLFDTIYQTGGFEQNRRATYAGLYEDSLSGSPSFGSRYWCSNGRTYFLNLAVNF